MRLDVTQTNLLLFGCFHKVCITHLFCKSPLYTTLSDLTLAQKKNGEEDEDDDEDDNMPLALLVPTGTVPRRFIF